MYVQPTYITVLPEWTRSSEFRSAAQINNEVNLKDNNRKDGLSDKAIKRVKNSVNWLVAAAPWQWVYHKSSGKRYKFKINFITLTLPASQGNISDHYFKSVMLRKFINRCTYNYGLKNYIWKVEAQASGQIHAHFTTDTFIHYMAIRRTWNKICADEGLIDKFEKKHGHRDPNSTDVHSVSAKTRIGSYICKEMSKQDENRRRIKGRLWACSYSLSSDSKCFADPWADVSHTWIDPLSTSDIKMIPIESEPNKFGQRDKWGEVYLLDDSEWSDLKGSPIYNLYAEHLYAIRNNMQLFPPEYYKSMDYEVTLASEPPPGVAPVIEYYQSQISF